ncbi:transglycosylase SLT domain-containing protein [Streptococcus macacae]|uniref:Transglycosylase-like domain protein n=1 Tax=Streptococcus macacae NCTC 11558 TaxID=764298 RepID=G5JX38_9STRE|nr:transglycosylase SLT domain-containing protein [Streptococcus macacae]EHJ51542.1 transglycosylase-like domain protein [Streptococcus macacae NCTC 11558]SUN79749.1 transglycosylase protein [Streptococcus macacae NCTC 11558]
MYSRVNRTKMKKKKMMKGQVLVLPFLVGAVSLFTGESVNTEAHIKKSESVLAKKNAAQAQEVNSPATTAAPSEAESTISVAEVTQAQTENQGQANYQTAYASQTAQAANANGNLTNGNSAGATGSAAAAQMAAATGVSQSTWEYIIARESNGQSNVRNASGAAGLFQTMPGWGSTATVQDQVNSAINAYKSQGLSAWGM